MKLFLFITVFSIVATYSQTAEGRSKGRDMRFTLANAGGQTDPSYASPITTPNHNAAGLVHNGRTKAEFSAATNTDFDPFSIGGSFLFSGKASNFAGGIGAFMDTTDNTPLSLSGGLAFSAGSYSAIGAVIRHNFDLNLTDARFGFIVNPYQNFRIGLNAHSLRGGFDAFGFGVGMDFGRGWTFGGDFTADENFESKVVTLGARFAIPSFSIGGGYAIGLDNVSNAAQSVPIDQPYASVGFWVGKSANIKFYYQNNNATYYLAGTFFLEK